MKIFRPRPRRRARPRQKTEEDDENEAGFLRRTTRCVFPQRIAEHAHFSVIPAKAGVHDQRQTGFRLSPE
jgi:hypothetical protein